MEGKTFKELVSERNAVQNERKELNEIIEKQNDKMANINEQIRKMSKNIDKGCKTLEDVEAKIREINYKMTTETIPVAKEKELFKQVQFLEKSKQYYDVFETLQKKLKAIKDQNFESKGQMSGLTRKLKGYQKKLDEMASEMKSKKELKDKFSEELSKWEEKVQEIKKEIGKLFEKKNEIKEQHYKEKFSYECQQEEIRYYEYLQHQKQLLIEEEKEKQRQIAEEKKREEEKLEKMKSMPNPFEDEINLCAYLISQLRLKKRDYENFVNKVELEAKQKEEEEERKKEIEKQHEAGKIQIYQKEEDPLPVGKKQKKRQKIKSKKPDAAPTQKHNPSKVKIDLKYDVVKGLVELGIDVPEHKVEDIDKAIEVLGTKKDEYEAKGQKKIQEVFKSENWQEVYERQLQGAEEEFLLKEEEQEDQQQKKPRKKQKYVRDDENDKPLE